MRWALSSTFVYSGIFAAAATTDAGIKQRRRDQWDRAIANIKHDLDHEQPTVQAEKESEEKPEYLSILDESQEVLLEGNPPSDEPPWPVNTGSALKRTFLAPNSIYAGFNGRQRTLDSRWTSKKLRTVKLSVDKLILRMLLHLDRLGHRQNLEDVVPESCLDFFGAPLSQIKAMMLYTNDQHMNTVMFPNSHADVDELPRQHNFGVNYSEDFMGDFHRTAAELDDALSLLFEKRRSGRLTHGHLVAKIAYNLYTSTAAPNIDCWNTLLVGLLGNDEDAALIRSTLTAIRNANVRMNETTMKTTLKYFTIIDSRTNFIRFVEKMRGSNGGLALARPDITITEAGRSRLLRDETTGKICQNPYPTPGVFEALVQGVLHFSGFDAALRVCKDMGEQGWGLSIRGLTSLLDDRARNADFESGRQVWDMIKILQKESRSTGQPERLFAHTYSAMLRLCSACNETARFDEILLEARMAKYSHRKLLALFKREMHPPQPRKLEADRFDMAAIRMSVSKEQLEQVVPKDARHSRETTLTGISESASSLARSALGLDDADNEEWLDSEHDSELRPDAADDWLLDLPMR